MNKHITPPEIEGQIIAEERKMLMWEWQSPPMKPINPVPPFNPDDALPVPRFKSPGAPVPLSERRKRWPRRDFF